MSAGGGPDGSRIVAPLKCWLIRFRKAGEVFVVVLASGALSACGSSSVGPHGSPAPYDVGFIGPLSGDLAFVGNPYRSGAMAYIQYVDSHGGVNGHQVRLTSGDDQNEPGIAATLVTQQVQQSNIVGLMEGGTTTVVGSLSPLLDQFQVPLVSWSCLPAQVFAPMQTKYCFETAVAASSQGIAQVAFALKLMPGARMLLVPTNNPYGGEWLSAAKSYAERNGGSIVGTTYVPLSGGDISAAVNAAASLKPQVVVTVFNDSQAVTFGQDLIRRGLEAIPVVNYSGGADKATFQTLDDPNFYALKEFPYPDDQQTDGMKQFAAAVTAAKIDINTPLIQDGYFAAYVLLAGLAQCGDSCTRSELAGVFDSLTVPMHGLAPDPFSFSPTNHQGVGALGVYQWKGAGLPQLVTAAPVR